jgi:hypothetical protein
MAASTFFFRLSHAKLPRLLSLHFYGRVLVRKVSIEIFGRPQPRPTCLRLTTHFCQLPQHHQSYSFTARTYLIVIAVSISMCSSSIGSSAPLPPTMVRQSAIPHELRAEIERRILVEKQTHRDILHWLARQGHICEASTLKRRCKEWGITRQGVGDDPAVVEYINKQFHTTLNDDKTIAGQLASLGYSITAKRV